jgi:hypothetical protein
LGVPQISLRGFDQFTRVGDRFECPGLSQLRILRILQSLLGILNSLLRSSLLHL